jgi:S1-C subfamily serine protease
MLRSAFLLLALCGAALAQADADVDLDALRATVVQVFVVSQPEDYAEPWKRPAPESSGGSAFYIGENRLLTNAHVVSDARNLLVKRADRPQRYEARVLFAGHDCDLAVITVEDASFFDGMKALEIGPQPAMRSSVATVGYPMGGNKLSITEGVVSRIELHTYSHSGADEHLSIQIDAAINPGNSGGPVIQGGKVVGVAFQGQFFAQNIGYMIPPSVIGHFLLDIEDGRYDGYPELVLYTATLENDSLRAYLGVPDGETGVVILKAMPYASCVGHVRRNDVLHEIDGIPVQNDGTVKVDGEFYDFAFVVEGKQAGESVTLTVRRGGEVLEIPVKLKPWGARMSPAVEYDRAPQYLVLGGYLFVPLTTNYLFRSRGNTELRYYMQEYYRMEAEEGKTREQLVLLSRVLPHRSTAYRTYGNAIVASVDGKVPNDFREFVGMVKGAGGDLVRIEFEGINEPPLILDRKKIAETQADINRAYGIDEDEHVEEGR